MGEFASVRWTVKLHPSLFVGLCAVTACSGSTHGARSAVDDATWPQPTTIDPVVTSMPASAETSIESVALYITAREPDPIRRLKALHDWVADRLRYDRAHEAAPPHATQLARFWENDAPRTTPAAVFSMQTYGPYPPAADISFRSRVGVCGDYASLLSELGKYAGLDVKYVTGYARSWGDEDEGYHAWNVAHVGDRYLMIDVTWDSQPFGTDYLFVPPEVFARSHYPDRAEDLHTTLSRIEFDAQPLTTPQFFAKQLELVGEVGNPMFAKSVARIEVDNPQKIGLRGIVFRQRRTEDWGYQTCTVKAGPRTVLECPLSTLGDYQVAIEPEGDSFVQPLAVVRVVSS